MPTRCRLFEAGWPEALKPKDPANLLPTRSLSANISEKCARSAQISRKIGSDGHNIPANPDPFNSLLRRRGPGKSTWPVAVFPTPAPRRFSEAVVGGRDHSRSLSAACPMRSLPQSARTGAKRRNFRVGGAIGAIGGRASGAGAPSGSVQLRQGSGKRSPPALETVERRRDRRHRLGG